MVSALTEKTSKLLGNGGKKQKNVLTPSQQAYAVEKLKIARERQASKKKANNTVTKIKVGIAKKRARLGSNLTRRPSRNELIAGGSKLLNKGVKSGRKLGKRTVKRVKKRAKSKKKGGGFNAHVRKLEKLNYI